MEAVSAGCRCGFFVRHAAQQKEAGEQLLFKVALPPVAQVDSS